MSRVVANLCWIVPGVVGGSEEYTTRLLRAVASGESSGVEVELAGLGALSTAHPDLAAGFKTSTLDISGSGRAGRIAIENSWLAARCRGADLVHHFGGHVPAVRTAPAVVTIHDTQPLDMAGNFSAVKRAYMSRMLPRTVAAARLVCTPSEWVRSRLVDRLGVDPSKVRVVPSTWDDRTSSEFHPDLDETELIDSLRGFQVVLYPAITHPHKNHTVLLEAVNRLAASHPLLRLVLTGGRGRAHAEVDACIARLALGDLVVQPGRVTQGAYHSLLELSDVLAFPSIYEGFGLPVLEAMRCGKPVVAANATALPEILAGAGILVDGHDPEAWAEAIESVLAGGHDIDRMVEAGRARSETFRPAESARRLIEAWRSVLS